MSEKIYQLIMQQGPQIGQIFPLLAHSLIIGRDPLVDVVISDPEVSRQHARLTQDEAGYQIQDLGSTNGTFAQAQKEYLAGAMGARLRRDLEADGAPAAVIEADVSRSYARMTNAPVLIVLCLTMADMDIYPDERRSHNEYVMAVQSTAMAGQNLLLAAHEAGLGACWMCAPLFCPDVVKTALGLTEDWQPQALLTMGYPAETREKTRKPLEMSVIWR